MKLKFILLFLLISFPSFSQELKLSFFEKLNSLPISSVKEILVDGYGFIEAEQNKYLHPKSTDQSNALLITVSDFEFQNKTRTGRTMEVICSENIDIFNFKSELLEQNYEYQGSSKDPSIDLKYYKKGSNKDVTIFVIKNGDVKKYQITFITRH